MALTLLKLGGELLEEPGRLAEIAAVIAGATEPLVVVHGGGREIDAALKRAGIAKRQVEGLRVTDPATLDVVVEVLAGAVNTRLVAAIVKAGGRAVGLTGADAGLVPVEKAPAHRSVDGTMTDLERVGRPVGGETQPSLRSSLGNFATVHTGPGRARDETPSHPYILLQSRNLERPSLGPTNRSDPLGCGTS